MRLDPRRRGHVALALIALVALLLAAPFVLGAQARHLSAFGDGPEDAALFRDALESQGARVESIVATVHALRDVERPEETLLVILGAERRYDASEAQAIRAFLDAGGRVLLVDETGHGSDVSQAAGFAFSAHRVLDTRNHLGDPKLVVAEVRLDGQPFRVLFNAPASLVPLSASQRLPHAVLATSSPARYPDGSYLDVNGDGAIDLRDQAGPFPLVVEAPVGKGLLVLVSDTGVFMNRQLALTDYDNAAFARALAARLVPESGVVLVDESRHASPPALAAMGAAARTAGRALLGPYAPLFLVALLAAAAAAWRLTRETEDWSHHGFDLGYANPLPAHVHPDVERMQRFARRRINEKYNIPIEQVTAMTAEELLAQIGDRALALAACGAPGVDPVAFFRTSIQEATA